MSIIPDLSPGVKWEENDQSTYVAAAAGKVGALAAKLSWGPTNTVMYIDNMQTVLDSCGYPDESNMSDYLMIKSFLAYSNTLYLTRVVGTDAKNAYALAAGAETPEETINVGNSDAYSKFNYPSGVIAIGKYPGSAFNGYKVRIYNYAGIAIRDCEKYDYGREIQTDTIVVTSKGSATVGATLTVTDTDIGDYKPRAGDWVILMSSSNAGLFTNKLYEKGGVLAKIVSQSYDEGNNSYTFILDSQIADGTIGECFIFHDNYVTNIPDPNYAFYQLTNLDGNTVESFTSKVSEIVDDINRKSIAIWMDDIGIPAIQASPVLEFELVNGTSGEEISDVNYINSYSVFKDKEGYVIDFLMSGMAGITCQKYLVDEISSSRKDCVTFLTPPYSAVVDNKGNEVDSVLEWRTQIGASSYAFIEGCWKQIYSEFDGKYYWIPTNADTAGLCTLRDPWVAIAGKNYGSIKNCIKISWQPNKTQYDVLFQKDVNAIKTISGSGTFLWGDKTAYGTNSALDALSVRNTLIYIERIIQNYAESVLWENNTPSTQQRFKLAVTQRLNTIKGAEGISDFEVICDSSVNTADVLNNKMFVAKIRIKPVLPIRNILLEFIVTQQGAEFNETTE